MKKPARFLSLLMAVMMLVGSAVPAYAFEGLGEISNITDYGEDTPFVTEDDEDLPTLEEEPREEEPPSSSEPQPDVSVPPVVDTGEPPEDSEGESLQGDADAPLPTEPTVGASGLDPPDSFSFEAVRSGSASASGMRKARANPGSTTIYMEKISGLSHLYPFSGGTTYSAYKMYTADGRAAFCVEPARFNSTNSTVVTGSLSYSALSSTQQKEIAKAIAASGGYSNGDKYFAAQAIIWEICYGQTPRSGSVYKAVIAANSGRLGSYYEQIRADMESMGEIPSFMSPDPNNPTIHEMTDNGGSWSIDLENTNSSVTLNASDFTSRAPFDFSVSGDTLTVESDSEPDQDAYVEWHSGSGESGLIFWNSSQQTKASFDETQGIPADGYMAFTNNFIPNPPDTPETPPEEPGLGYLTIVKYDGDTNLPLGGAIFKVECDGYINDAVDVPYGGKTIVIPIPEGQTQVDVTVTEVTAPSGYVKDSTPKTVTVTANETVNIVEVGFVNYPEACSLEIYKYETGNKGVALEGASFRIRYADPNVSAQTWTETTDGSGKIHIDLPAAGALIVEELSAPTGYVMNTKTSYDVTVAKGEQKTIDIPNDKKTQLVAIKKDAQSGQLLAGASIRATLLRSNTPPYEGGQSYTETTGPDGRAVFTNLIPGEYRVEEIAPPQFYMGTTTVHTVNILDGNTETVTVEFRNEPWTGLTIRKVDKINAKGLPGAIFKLYKGSEEDPKAYLGDWESGENGSVTIQKLEPGYYTIVESQAPYGYLLDQEHHVQTIEIKPEAVDRNITVVFQNLPKPKLLIEKIDKVTGLRLPGAVFHVSRRGSEEYMEVRTGSDGTVLLENLEDDWYTVTEVRAPSGYVLDSRHYDVEMIPGKTVPLIINNLQQPDLLLRKVDEQTGSGVPGAVLRITKDGAKEYKDVTTGADGTYLVKDLEPGWYIVEEIKAPDGYLLNDEPQYIELIAGQDSELIIKNRHKPSLEILKIDSVTKQPLEGVAFRVQIKNGKTLGEYRTDAVGRIYLENIDPELYVVTEVKAPDGYILLTGSKEALVEWGKTTTLQFENQPRNPILVKKVDTKTGEPLAGAKFLIQQVNGAYVAELETGRNGYITVTDLDPGWYTVKETKAPLGYILDDTVKTVELKPDAPAVVEFENQPLNGLHIKKIDSKTQAPLEGAKFRVSEKGGRLIGEYTTDNQGEIVIDDLQPGWYTIEETKAPNGYRLDNTPKDVEFVWGQFVTVEFTNELLSPIQIRKIDSETGAPLAGAKFRITKANGEYVGDFSTSTDGFLNVPELEPGFYIVSETKAPEGYLLDNTPQTIEVKANVPTMVEFVNKRLPGLQVQKIDANTGEPLAGAKFRVEKSNGERMGDFVTNSAGFFVAPDLEAGTYTVYETAAPAGYILDKTPQTAVLRPNGTTTLEFSNKPLAGLQIKKVDAVTGLPMKGVEFKITKLNSEPVGIYVTDDAGLIFVPDMKEGWYVVTETRTLDGYKLDNAPRNVEVASDKLNLVEYRNQPYPHLQLVKIDAETKAPIEGVRFKVSDRLGRELGTFSANKLGQIHLTGMEQGTYYVQEVEAKPGYVLDSTVQEVSLLWGKTTKLEIPNTPLGTLRIKKIDSETKQPLFGAVFNLYDLKGNLLGEYTTDNRGIIEFPKEVQAGKYKLREVKAPAGYVLDEMPKTIEVKASETLELEVPNKPMRGQIQIVKTAAENNTITKDKAGALLEGAVFEIYNTRLEVVDRITTDSRGLAISKELPMGVYGIKEIAAPKYYFTDGTVFYAELKVDGDLVRFEVKNKPKDISVTIEKRGNVQAMPGDVIFYTLDNIANTSNIPLEEFYVHDLLPTDAVRLNQLSTGTWSEKGKFDVLYRTNKKDAYRTLASNLSTTTDNQLECGREALGLAANEYVTDIKLQFAEVGEGFHSVTSPTVTVTVLADLPDGYQFTNRADVGGRTEDEWVYAKDAWTTCIFAPPRGCLPKTGFGG